MATESTRTWEPREMVLMQAIRADERPQGGPRWEELVERTGLPAADVQASLRHLYRADYIHGIDATGMGGGFELLEIELLERGLRAVGQWPSDDPLEDLVRLLDERIAVAEPAERSKLERLRDGLVGVGRDVGTSVLTAWLKGQAGIP